MNRAVLDQINLVCGDPDASVAFYRRLGVEMPEARIWRTSTGPHHISAAEQATDQSIAFDLDSVEFARRWNTGWKNRTELKGFSVATREEVDAIFHDMTGAGYRGLQEPCDAFWGARYAIIEDPDGVAVGLMSPVSPDMKSPPPDV